MLNKIKKLTSMVLLTATLAGCEYESIEPRKPELLKDPIIARVEETHEDLTYKSDGPKLADDYWQSPEESIKRDSGDCEDFARLLYERLLNKRLKDDGIELDAEVTIGLLDSANWYSGHGWIEKERNDTTYILDATRNVVAWRSNPEKGIISNLNKKAYYIYPHYIHYAQRRLAEYYSRNKEYFNMKNLRIVGIIPVVEKDSLIFYKSSESGGRVKTSPIDLDSIMKSLPPIGNYRK